MWRTLLLLLMLCTSAYSEESNPREPQRKPEASYSKDQHGEIVQQITLPPNSPSPSIINVFAGKHAGEESQCTKPKDWKEWGSFAFCRADQLIDAERVIAAFTVILGIATWFLWRATVKLVQSADRTAERQLRAYVSVKEFKMDEFRGPPQLGVGGHIIPGPITSYRIEAIFENGGQTPTRLGILNVAWELRSDALPPEFNYSAGKMSEKVFIGPRCTFGTPGFFVPSSDVAQVVERTKHLFVWGWIDYNDVFEKTPRHRTEFCAEIVADHVPNGSEIYLRFPTYGPFNGADEDCLRKPTSYAEP